MSSQHQDLLEKQSQRFYAQYERKANSFRTALITVTGLLTVVFVLIFYPYVTFRGTRYVLETQLEAVTGDLTEAQSLAKGGQWLRQAYHLLMEEVWGALADVDLRAIDGAAPEHARRLADIRALVGDDPDLQPWSSGEAIDKSIPANLRHRYPELSVADDDPCFWRSGESWIRCTLDLQLGTVFSKAEEVFDHKRYIPPIDGLPGDLDVSPQLRNDLFLPLYQALSELRQSYGAYLLAQAPDWQLDGAKVEGKLRDQHDRFLSANFDLLSEHNRFVGEAVSDLDREVQDLEDELEIIEQGLATTIAKLEGMKGLQDIQTPFGPLPVGLNEFVLLLPVLLAAGFLLCASLFAESLRLRREYHRLALLQDPQGTFIDGERIALIAPVWIDPLKPARHRLYRIAISALPVVVFVVSILLLLANDFLFGPFMEEARLASLIYVVLYVLSALAMLEGGRRVWQALRTYFDNSHIQAT